MKYRILYLAILAVLAIAWSNTGARAGGDVPTTYRVDSLDDVNTSYVGNKICESPCTLRDALIEANTNDAADTIVFDSSLFSGGAATITLAGSLPTIIDDLTITGPGAAMLTIDADGVLVISESAGKGVSTYRTIFNVDGAGPLDISISGMTLTNAVKSGDGPALYATDDDIILEDVVFSYNLNDGEAYGGAVHVASGTLSVTDCMFIGNQSVDSGGAIFANASVTVTNSDFMDNESGDDGGAIYVYGDSTGISLTMTGGTLEGNYADSSGGGIYLGYSGGTAMLTGVRLTSNGSGGDGGAIHVYYGSGTAMLNGVMLTSNYTYGSGGGIFGNGIYNGVELENSVVLYNSSSGAGGGLYLGGSSPSTAVVVSNSRVDGNQSTGSSGGGVYFWGNSLEIEGSSISSNTAFGDGGGLNVNGIYGDDSSVSVAASTIAGNISEMDGGGAYFYVSNTAANALLLNTTISGNMADGSGGGLYLSTSGGSTVEVTHNTITDNTADFDDNGSGDGGGIYASGDTPVVTNTILSGNSDDTTLGESAGKAPVEAVHPDCSGSITTAGVNLFGDTNGCDGTFTNDLTDADPMLSDLIDVPGLGIAVHDLKLGSAAIDAADPAECAEEDALGQVRSENACDIGAVESVAFKLFLAAAADDGCTLQASGGGVASSMTLLVLAVAGAFAFERRRRRG